MKFNLRSIILPITFLGMGVSALATTPRFGFCSTLETGRFDLFTWWGGFVGYWALAGLGMAVLSGVLLYAGRDKDTLDIPPAITIGVIAAAGIAFLWFGFLLPYRRPCIGTFLWVYVGWAAAALVVAALLKPVWVARLGAIIFGIVLGFLLLEGGVRLIEAPEQRARASAQQATLEQPGYEVLYIQPEPYVGWKMVPDFEFTWTGRRLDCIEYRVDVKTNSTGFRDVEWQLDKPEGTLRVAVIGDSFVEALQVPLEQTASKVLEKRLSEELNLPEVERVEVMNVGVSNYSVGQYLMLYEEYVEPFQPDYVFIFVANLHMVRTFERYYGSQLIQGLRLNVRPTYRIDQDGQLEYVPAADYERFEKAIQNELDTRFGEDRIYELDSPEAAQDFYSNDPYVFLRTHSRLLNRVLPASLVWPPKLFDSEDDSESDAIQPENISELNFRIIEELNTKVQASGGKLIFVDAFLLFDSTTAPLSEQSRELSEEIGAGYINLSEPLIESDEPYDWACDSHFNANGHRIFADTMFEWLKEDLGYGP